MPRSGIKLNFSRYTLHFKEPAGTSRGILLEKPTYFLKISDADNPQKVGYGEIPYFPGLSFESREELEAAILSLGDEEFDLEILSRFKGPSSLIFGLESALKDFQNGSKGIIFPSSFTDRKCTLTINGLIWMGTPDKMIRRIERKLEEGFSCIKIKIGALEWKEELKILTLLRETGGKNITIRVDANGGFSPRECLDRLDDLARIDIHSIEQPVKANQWEEMRRICRLSPIPVALDEELIGVPPGKKRDELLDFLQPQFLILKPALCYGFSGTSDWIKRAGERGIGWWITSALESSVGLSAIAQYVGTLNVSIPQGLGTGNLYTDNLPSPVCLHGENLSFSHQSDIYYRELENLFC